MASVRTDPSAASFPKIFDLPKDKGLGMVEEQLTTLARIPLTEIPALVVRVKHPKRHVIVFWGIERLARSFSNLSWLYGKTVVFASNFAEGTVPPTVLVDKKWWDLYDTEFVSESEATTALLGSILGYNTRRDDIS